MVSPVTHAAGTPVSKARSSIPLARSSGLVANSTSSSGMPASAQRSASFAQLLGRYKARSTKAALLRGIAEEHADLAVLLLARRTRVLRLDTSQLGPLLQEAGLVADEHRPLVCDVLDHVLAQVVSDLLGVPLRLVEQPLHTIGGAISNGLLGHLLAVLTPHRSGESLQVS